MSALSSIVNNTSPKGKQASLPPPATTINGTGSVANVTASTGTPTANAAAAQTGQYAENSKGAVATLTTADDVKYKRKYKDLKKRIRDIEEDNDILNIKLSRARKNIHRLRVERSFLFDKLDQSEQPTHHSSSSLSTTDSDDDEDRNGEDPSKSHRHNSRHGLDNLKRYRHAYSSSHHGGQSHSHHPGRLDSSHHQHHNSHVPTNSASHHGRSKTPPSRSSSVAGSVSAQHSVSPSLGGSVSSNQMIIVEPANPQQGASSLSPLSGKRATKKRRKDPLAPKRPSNAFFIFSQQHRQQAREEKKEGNQSELTKFLGQQWKSMPSTEKKIYSELAIQDRQRYMDEMSQYEQGNGQEIIPTVQNDASKARKKTPGKVGRPSKHEKYAALDVQAKEDHNGHGNSNGSTNSPVTTTNGSGHSLAKKKMEIVSMINGDTEGEDMTSHDDEDDTRMEDGTEDDHDHDNDHEDEEDEDDQDEDPEEEEEEEEEGDVTASEQDVSLSHAHPHEKAMKGVLRYSGHEEDVDMVGAHQGQEPGSAHSLVASA